MGLNELSVSSDKFKISTNDKKTKVLVKNKKNGAGQENILLFLPEKITFDMRQLIYFWLVYFFKEAR